MRAATKAGKIIPLKLHARFELYTRVISYEASKNVRKKSKREEIKKKKKKRTVTTEKFSRATIVVQLRQQQWQETEVCYTFPRENLCTAIFFSGKNRANENNISVEIARSFENLSRVKQIDSSTNEQILFIRIEFIVSCCVVNIINVSSAVNEWMNEWMNDSQDESSWLEKTNCLLLVATKKSNISGSWKCLNINHEESEWLIYEIL